MSDTAEFEVPSFDIGDIAPLPTVPDSVEPSPEAQAAIDDYTPAPPNVPLNPDSLQTVRLKQDPQKRGPGRPKGSRNASTPPAPIMSVSFSATEISESISTILRSATGSLGHIKPYLEMTEKEVEGIAKPMARWMARTAPSSPRVAGVINKFDLVTAATTAAAYSARVGYARHEETQAAREAQIARSRAKVVGMDGQPVRDGDPNGPIMASQPLPTASNPMVPISSTPNGEGSWVSQPAIPR